MVEHVLSGGGQRGDRAAVEAVVQRDDAWRAPSPYLSHGVFARGLDGALVGLRAGVGEEHLASCRCCSHSIFASRTMRLGVIEVGGVLHACPAARSRPAASTASHTPKAVRPRCRCPKSMYFLPLHRRTTGAPCPLTICHMKARIGIGDICAVSACSVIRSHKRYPSSVHEHGADALVGEHFDQDGVGHAPVDDEHAASRPGGWPQCSTRTLGIMPPEITPSRISCGASDSVDHRNQAGSDRPCPAAGPAMSVMEIMLSAPSAPAMRAAAVSALML